MTDLATHGRGRRAGGPTSRPVLLLVWLLPALALAWSVYWVAKTYAPVPFWDQWLVATLFEQWRDQRLGWADLIAQHNEHRILFPRLLFLADYLWGEGRNYLNLAGILLTQLLAALLFVVVARRTSDPLVKLAAASAAVMMFALAQWENFFWGFQVQFVGVFCIGAWGIYAFASASLETGRRQALQLALTLLLLVYATFSMANGVFFGAAAVGAALVCRRPWKPSLLLAAATGFLLWLYLQGYHRVEGHAGLTAALDQPLTFAAYIPTYLGGPFASGHLHLAFAVGTLGLLAAAAMPLALWRKPQPSAAEMAMLGIVLFTGLSAAATAAGRVTFGLHQALSPRYATPALYFWSALAVFWALMLPERRRAGRAVLASGLAVGLAALAWVQVGAAHQLRIVHERLLRGAAAAASEAPDTEALRQLHPDPAYVMAQTAILRDARLAFFADGPLPRIGALFRRPAQSPPPACLGAFDALSPAPEGAAAFRALGWAWDPVAGRAVSRIVLVSTSGKVVGLGFGGLERPDVPQAIAQVRSSAVGWAAAAPADLPPGPLTAFGLTAKGGVCRIGELRR